ncbi:protein FAM32A isoform X2 [Amborella trichopoda]|uniref:protein FAM32A isoform X2 n=1 Tax=Amborella trichopoda TaxID=13333 RepID=UPI0009BDF91F|nr:protein FAM32A isoform X2 [Amborella trichopoda]|eukprot:XP_020522612.1 protein FAM32A isoform X2 [Amborella trichopoda]
MFIWWDFLEVGAKSPTKPFLQHLMEKKCRQSMHVQIWASLWKTLSHPPCKNLPSSRNDPPSLSMPPNPSCSYLSLGFQVCIRMSEYESVVKGKLKLKGKALDVKVGGLKKKKKKSKSSYESISQTTLSELSSGTQELSSEPTHEESEDKMESEVNPSLYDDHLTPAERRYIEQRANLDVNRLAKEADKSHRDRIQDFNQYLANLSEHYDIPKVGPG